MRENRTSGGTRSEATASARYATIEPQPGKPRNRSRSKPKHSTSLAYSTPDSKFLPNNWFRHNSFASNDLQLLVGIVVGRLDGLFGRLSEARLSA